MKSILSFPDRPAPIWISDTQLYEVKPKVFCVLNTTLTASPAQTTWSVGLSTCAVGFTVIVKVLTSPAQTFPSNSNSGMTVTVATIGAADELVAVKARIFPLPLPERPIFGLLFVHV